MSGYNTLNAEMLSAAIQAFSVGSCDPCVTNGSFPLLQTKSVKLE